MRYSRSFTYSSYKKWVGCCMVLNLFYSVASLFVSVLLEYTSFVRVRLDYCAPATIGEELERLRE
jgi:hypothetical protein